MRKRGNKISRYDAINIIFGLAERHTGFWGETGWAEKRVLDLPESLKACFGSEEGVER